MAASNMKTGKSARSSNVVSSERAGVPKVSVTTASWHPDVLSNEDAVAASHVIGLGAERTVGSAGMRRVIVATVIALIVVSSCSSKRSSQAATVAWYTTETHSFDIAFIGRSWITAKPSNVISSYNASGVVDLVQNALELTGREGDEIDIGLDSWSKTPRPHVPGKPWVHYHQDPRLQFPGFNPPDVL
jgi:hypothetical protein